MNRNRRRLWGRLIAMALATMMLAIFGTTITFAQDTIDPTAEALAALQVSIDSTFVFIAAIFVFFMQTGFAFLEAGMIRQRGAVNSMMENFLDSAFGGLAFFATGWALSMGVDNGSGLFGTTGFFLNNAVTITDGAVNYGSGISVYVLFFFQFVFCAAAGTIATGAMAERVNFIGKIIYSFIIAGFTYPIVIHWVWGGGWLAQQGFLDFAGSTAVHLSGAMLAIMGAIVIGPRIGRVWGSPPKPHNLAYAALGTMILWLGWYGFNPGSALSMGNNGLVGLVAVTTTMAACAGAAVATLFGYFRTGGKWDLPAALNGTLAGLVGITAGCAFVSPASAIVIGAISGVLVLLTADVLEKLKIDDAAGAFAVHGVCGIFGTLAVGIFGQPELGANGLLFGGGVAQLGIQLLGASAVFIWMGLTSYIMMLGLKALGVLRISAEGDKIGIDLHEHGMEIWNDDVVPATSENMMPPRGIIAAPAGD